jgi:hypothetical protein
MSETQQRSKIEYLQKYLTVPDKASKKKGRVKEKYASTLVHDGEEDEINVLHRKS